MNKIFILLLLMFPMSLFAECESWTPDFKFKIEDASFRETMTWLSGWSFALEAIAKDKPELRMCVPECGFASEYMSEILNKEFSGKTITAEVAAETIWPEILEFYACDQLKEVSIN